MKITYDEFNELQEQQYVRDCADRTIHELRVLESVATRKRQKEIVEMIKAVIKIREEAISNIQSMIEGGEGEDAV